MGKPVPPQAQPGDAEYKQLWVEIESLQSELIGIRQGDEGPVCVALLDFGRAGLSRVID